MQVPKELETDIRQQAAAFAEELAAYLEGVFDTWAGSDQWIHFDRLELDLKDLPVSAWKSEAFVQVRQQLEKQWMDLEDGGHRGGGRPRDEGQRDQDLIAYYLQTGRFPWWFTPSPDKPLPLGSWMESGMLDPDRWALDSSALYRSRWAELLGNRMPEFLDQWRFLKAASSASGPAFLAFHRDLWVQGSPSVQIWRHRLIETLVGMPASGRYRVLDAPIQAISLVGIGAPDRRFIQNACEKAYGYRPMLADQEANTLGKQQGARDRNAQEAAPGNDGLGKEEGEPRRITDRPRGEEALETSWAGMVLLAPFFPRLFENRCMVPWENPADRVRALRIWDYLAKGADSQGLEERILFKIFMGLNPETPIPIFGGPMDREDQKEADLILDEVARHWRRLGQSSGAAIREHFLQRRGTILATETGWTMKVKAETLDVLIPFIPWTIGWIRLPWMTKPLITDWKI